MLFWLFLALFRLIPLQNNQFCTNLFKFLVYVKKHPNNLGNFYFLCIGPIFFVFWPSKGPKPPKNVKNAKNDMFYMSPLCTEAVIAYFQSHFLLGLWYSQLIHKDFTRYVPYFFLHSHLSVFCQQNIQMSFQVDTSIQ